jgi:hypothetical protein
MASANAYESEPGSTTPTHRVAGFACCVRKPNEAKQLSEINNLIERAWGTSRCSRARRKRGRVLARFDAALGNLYICAVKVSTP